MLIRLINLMGIGNTQKNSTPLTGLKPASIVTVDKFQL